MHNEELYLYVTTPPVRCSFGELEFLLLETAVFLIRDLHEDEEHTGHDASRHHHEHTCRTENDLELKVMDWCNISQHTILFLLQTLKALLTCHVGETQCRRRRVLLRTFGVLHQNPLAIQLLHVAAYKQRMWVT